MILNSFCKIYNIELIFFQWMLTLTVILSLLMKMVKKESYFQKDYGMPLFKLEKTFTNKFTQK